jgi:ketosteroid isomerase-like protein
VRGAPANEPLLGAEAGHRCLRSGLSGRATGRVLRAFRRRCASAHPRARDRDRKEAIRAHFDWIFDHFDTSAYAPRYDIIDVHGDQAYILASFDEVLRPKDGHPGIRIHGRAVHFWRRDPDGAWRVLRLLTARSAPEEPEVDLLDASVNDRSVAVGDRKKCAAS